MSVTAMKIMKVGIIGCGNISRVYVKNLKEVYENLSVSVCCDLDEEKAKAAAEKSGACWTTDISDVLRAEDVDIVLNLTTPGTHYDICKAALDAGKHVYTEKPLSLDFAHGKELVNLAGEKGLYLGCAPDTFLGAGLQTAIKAVSDGLIGRPVAGVAAMMCRGHESWHPSPDFYYDYGGGPLYDMGPYYITALVRLLGRAESVTAFASRAFNERLITSQPKAGKKIPVKVDTHHTGVIRFANGALITVMMSFDVYRHHIPPIEIYGTDGSLCVPDPNTFSGSVVLYSMQEGEKRELEHVSNYTEQERGIGLSDMALAISENRNFNASGSLALHVLEIMEAFVRSAKENRAIEITTTPDPMIPLDWSAEKGKLKTL